MAKQLSWKEVSDALTEATQLDPEDFYTHIANYVPQGVWEKLRDEVQQDVSHFSPLLADSLTGAYMAGFHMGWLLAERIFDED